MAKKATNPAQDKAPAKTKAIKKAKAPAAAAAPAAPALQKQASKKDAVAPVLAKQASAKKDNTVYPFDTLYILLLDMSGSMWGKGWEDLMNAVKQFLTTVSADAQLTAKSRVSIITYDD